MGLLLVFAVIMPSVTSAQQWSEIIEITPNDSKDDEYPQSVVHNATLYVVWQMENNIALRSYDGTAWSAVRKLSNSDLDSMNRYPQIIVYNNMLYVVWETNDAAISSGSDWDIVLLCYDSEWRYTEVTDKNDNVDDYNPQMTAYENRLYIVWQSNNDIVMRKYDARLGSVDNPDSWSKIENITSSNSNDYAPKIAVYDNNLCILWVTEDEKISSGTDSDIVMKYKNEVIEITLKNDNAVDQHPQITIYNDELYIVWQTNNPEITEGDDDDIVIRCYNSFGRLGEICEISKNAVSDFGPEIIAHDKLYILWLKNSKELMMCSYDGNRFDNLCIKSMHQGAGFITKSCMASCIYGNKLYIIWQTQDESISSGRDWDLVYITYNIITDEPKQPAEKNSWIFIILALILSLFLAIGIYVMLKRKTQI